MLLQSALNGPRFRTVSVTPVCFNPFFPSVPTFAVRETASLGIMGTSRVPPLNLSEMIVLSEHYRLLLCRLFIMPRDAVSRTANVERTGRHKWVNENGR